MSSCPLQIAHALNFILVFDFKNAKVKDPKVRRRDVVACCVVGCEC
jgi:hypothetical protein